MPQPKAAKSGTYGGHLSAQLDVGDRRVNGGAAREIPDPLLTSYSLLLTSRPQRGRGGFTLTELLVVIGIIGLLIGTLVPVVSGARYRARMVTCASNLRQVGAGVLQYAADNGGYYPPRPVTDPRDMKPTDILAWGSDLRVPLKGYVDWNGLSCPFAPRSLNYTNITGFNTIEWTYNLWFGWQYQVPYLGANEKGAFKVGRPFTYQGRSFSVLASDQQYDSTNGNGTLGEHPTTGMDILDYTNNGFSDYFTRWNKATNQRGPLDLNFLFNDGSVSTIAQIPVWIAGPNFRSDVAAVTAFNHEDQAWAVPVPAGQ